MEDLEIPSHYVSADEPALKDRIWIEQQWEIARLRVKPKRAQYSSSMKSKKLRGGSKK